MNVISGENIKNCKMMFREWLKLGVEPLEYKGGGDKVWFVKLVSVFSLLASKDCS